MTNTHTTYTVLMLVEHVNCLYTRVYAIAKAQAVYKENRDVATSLRQQRRPRRRR